MVSRVHVPVVGLAAAERIIDKERGSLAVIPKSARDRLLLAARLTPAADVEFPLLAVRRGVFRLRVVPVSSRRGLRRGDIALVELEAGVFEGGRP